MSFLLESSLRAVLVAGAVAAVVHGLRIANARARHLAWCGVLAAMLLLPAFCAWGPRVKFRVLPQRSDAFPVAWTPTSTAPSETISAPSTPAVPGRLGAVSASAQAGPVLLWMYLPIVGLFFIRLVYGALRAASVCRRARPEEGFLSSPEVACPVTVGWWKPVIVLPSTWTGWPKAELNAVLAHEGVHVRRCDPLVQSLAALNRCLFWFHPLAWWLEHRLSALAEDVCDAAVIASGHDARDYSEYLIHQARAVERAGARIALAGSAIAGRGLSRRIRRLLDGPPAPLPSRPRAMLGGALCILSMIAFTACQLDRTEKAATGQPTMHELARHLADSNIQHEEHRKAILDRARSLTAQQAQQLFARLKDNPLDPDTYWTLVRHYEFQVNVKDLSAVKLWYIEHQPAGPLWGGPIDPHIDPAGYQKGKALWLANLKQSAAPADFYQRAADFLEGGDKPLAESVLQAGRNAYPSDERWPMAFGRHYAQVLLGSTGPLTEFNVIRTVSSEEAQTAYAQAVRAQLAGSRDARVLAQTTRWLLAWGNCPAGKEGSLAAVQLARTYVERALLIEPDSSMVQSVKMRLTQMENIIRLARLKKMSAAELVAAPAADRMLLLLHRMRDASVRQKLGDAESKAQELLELAAHNPNDALYGQAVFEANIVVGKGALRRGNAKTASRYLLAAAETPGSDEVRRGEFDMNLPRALVDRGERRAVIDFFKRMAPKTHRAKEFQEWAAELSKGINPNLLPIFFASGCSNDPC